MMFFGCEDNQPAPTTPSTVTPSGMQPGTTPNPTPTTHTVIVGPANSLLFSPQTLTIAHGDTVHWQWESSSVAHTVTSGSAPNADGQFCSVAGTPSAGICQGTGYATTAPFTYDHTFPAAGTFPYFCTVHGAAMTGTIVVQ